MTESAPTVPPEDRRDPYAPPWGRRDVDRYIEDVVGSQIKSLEVTFEGFVQSAEGRLQAKIVNGFESINRRLDVESLPKRVRDLEAKRQSVEVALVITCIAFSGLVALVVSILYDFKIARLLHMLN